MLKAREMYHMIAEDWKAEKDLLPWDKSDREWTRWIKDYLDRKSEKFNCRTERTNSGSRGQGEYLVDLCWWQEKDETGHYCLQLILESEWNCAKDELLQDFYKLIDIKAALKIWICSWGENQVKERLQLACKYVSRAKYKIPGEEYLIINLPVNKISNYKDRMVIEGWLIDYKGQEEILEPSTIERNNRS